MSADKNETSLPSKVQASRWHHNLAKNGHPLAAGLVGAGQAAVAIHETFYITYTCRDCGHKFNKAQAMAASVKRWL
ncbi:MAG: hypothetical protein JSS66_17050 [Armatimonadetes bacterium]|nr:hypothetical protein [Armatimonadota bacterium]